jgi:hypothetical protein
VTRVRVIDATAPVGDVDAIVVEDDTRHVLSADPAWRPVRGSLRRALEQAVRSQPDPLGSVTAIAGEPLRLCAVVHDLEREPSCDPASVQAALHQLLALAGQRGLVRIALPLLGTVHGRLPLVEAVRLLVDALARSVDCPLREVELRVDAAIIDTVRALIAAPAIQ